MASAMNTKKVKKNLKHIYTIMQCNAIIRTLRIQNACVMGDNWDIGMG